MRKQIENIIENLNNNTITLKAAKAEYTLIDSEVELSNIRRKDAFIELLNGKIEELADDPMVKLEKIAKDINSNLSTIQHCNFAVGESLLAARDLFSSQKDFLSWAKSACGLQKAQVYKLMSVYNRFGKVEVFSTTAMRVLYTLTKCSDEVVAKAEEIAKSGNLDTPTLNGIIDAVEGPKNPPTTPVDPQEGDSNPPEDQKAGSQDGDSSGNGSTPPVDPKGNGREGFNTGIDNGSDHESDETEQSEQVTAMEDLIKNLQEQLEIAKAELKAEKEKSARILPQFKNDCMYARLGLSVGQSEDKKEVNKAYRALAKLYPAVDYPEVAELLVEAKNALTA